MKQAQKARGTILDRIEEEISKPRPNISVNAPKILIIKINPDKIGLVIGGGGKTIKEIKEKTGAEITIEDDGEGYPKDVLNKIGEPYIKSFKSSNKSKAGLGLGIFIGTTLLEKNHATVFCKNSKIRSGAEVIIRWENKKLLEL